MSSFRFSKDVSQRTANLKFEGSIDEDSEFPTIGESEVDQIVIDLKGVKGINSVGIREWMNWIRPLATGAQVTLVAAPKPMVFQFNMVDGFVPNKAKVISFFVPFFCETCDKEQEILFTVGKDVVVQNGNVNITFDPKAANICDSSNCAVEMDVSLAKYFQFLKKM